MNTTKTCGHGISGKANLLESQSDCVVRHGYSFDDRRVRKFPRSEDCILCDYIRRKALAFIDCSTTLSRVHVDDAINLVLILFQTGNLDLYSDPKDFQEHLFFDVDESTKKVNKLFLQKSSDSNSPLQLAAETISSLDSLEDLKLCNVNVTSADMEHGKSAGYVWYTKELPLSNLKNLDVCFLKTETDDEEAVFQTKVFHLLPRLEKIVFQIFTGRIEKLFLRNVFSDMGNSFCACQKTLRSIGLSNSMCTEDELMTLLVDVVPKLPNLVDINMGYNKIDSFQRIAECVSANKNIANNSLQILDLSCNIVLSKITENLQEKAAMMTFLRIFKGLYNLGNHIEMLDKSPEIKYQLQINHAGRRLMEDASPFNATTSTNLIPFVLERAFEKSRDIYPSFWRYERKKDPTGVYYLLRNWSIVHG